MTDNNREYAMRRTSEDGSRTALLVYLFSTSSGNETLHSPTLAFPSLVA